MSCIRNMCFVVYYSSIYRKKGPKFASLLPALTTMASRTRAIKKELVRPPVCHKNMDRDITYTRNNPVFVIHRCKKFEFNTRWVALVFIDTASQILIAQLILKSNPCTQENQYISTCKCIYLIVIIDNLLFQKFLIITTTIPI